MNPRDAAAERLTHPASATPARAFSTAALNRTAGGVDNHSVAPRTAHARPRRAAAAFTLVELVVVLLVLVVAAGLAMPMFAGGDATRLRQAARLLAADLDYARVESIAHADDPRVVAFDPPAGRYRVAAQSDPATPIAGGVAGQPYDVRFGEGRAEPLAGVAFATDPIAGDNAIRFGIYGELDEPADVAIPLACGDLRLTLTVDRSTGQTAIGDFE